MTDPRETVDEPARKRVVIPWIVAGVFAVALGVILAPRFLGGGEAADAAADGPAPVAESTADAILTAAEKCEPEEHALTVSENNSKLVIKGEGKTSVAGLDDDGFECAFDILEVPGALRSRMVNTSEDDLTLQGEWPGYKASWRNSDDEGLLITIVRTE